MNVTVLVIFVALTKIPDTGSQFENTIHHGSIGMVAGALRQLITVGPQSGKRDKY